MGSQDMFTGSQL